MKLNSESREEDVTFLEIRLNYLRDQRDIAFTMQGKMGRVLRKARIYPGESLVQGLGDGCGCYKIVLKENQL